MMPELTNLLKRYLTPQKTNDMNVSEEHTPSQPITNEDTDSDKEYNINDILVRATTFLTLCLVALVVVYVIGVHNTPTQADMALLQGKVDNIQSTLTKLEKRQDNIHSTIVADKGALFLLLSTVDSSDGHSLSIDRMGTIIAFSKGMTNLTGISNERAKGMPIEKLMDEKTSKQHRVGYQKVMESTELKIHQTVVECGIISKDGSQVKVTVKTTSMPGLGAVANITLRQ